MAYPILAPNSTWYKSSAARNTITEINIVDSYTPTGSEDETWNADVDDTGSIKCYRTGTVLTIAGNGSGKIAMNADSSYLFSSSGSDKFSNLTNIANATLLDSSSATNFLRMFYLCKKLESVDVSNWQTGNVTNMNGVFNQALALENIDVSNWDTSSCTDMAAMFQLAIKLTTLDLSRWNVSNVTSMQNMFMGHSSVGDMIITSIGDVSNWDVSKVTNMANMFQFCPLLENLGVSNWKPSSCTTMTNMFRRCTSLTTLDVSTWDVGNVTNMSYMFQQCSSLATLDVSNWDVSNVTTMQSMFRQCYSLTSLDVSNWDVGNVTTMQDMFSADNYGATPFKLTTLDVSKWDTSSCTNMSFMFYGMKGNGYQGDITIDISKWDVSKVTIFDHMFANSSCTITNVSKWNTASATNMGAMFHKIKNKSIDVSSFDTSNVTNFGQMFEYCYYLEEIIGLNSFDTSQGISFDEMFGDCCKLKELDLSSFDTRKAKDGVTMSANGGVSATLMDIFRNMRCLEKITLGENFSFNGDGTTAYTSHHAVLPTPSAAYIEGADGNWYDVEGNFYEPSSMTDGARTYYASPDLIPTVDLIKRGTMVKLGNVLRKKSDTTQKYTPLEMVSEFNNLESAGSYNQGYDAGMNSIMYEPWSFQMADGSTVEIDFTSSESIVMPAGEVTSISSGNKIIYPVSSYTEMTYLESTGTQWIDTLYTPEIGDEFEFKNVSLTTNNGTMAVFSAGVGTYQLILLSMNATYYYKYFATGGASTLSINLLNNPSTITIDNAGRFYFNGTNMGSSTPTGDVDTSLRLFCRANDTSCLQGKIGEVKITNGGSVKLHLIPVLDVRNVPCMYDKVSRTFLYNQGSGDFLCG